MSSQKKMGSSQADEQGDNDNNDMNDYEDMPDPTSEDADLSQLRGTTAPTEKPKTLGVEDGTDDGLDALAELVPDLKNRKNSLEHNVMTLDADNNTKLVESPGKTKGEGQPVIEMQVEEDMLNRVDSIHVQASKAPEAGKKSAVKRDSLMTGENIDEDSSSDAMGAGEDADVNEVLYGNGDYPQPDDANSDQALSSNHSKPRAAVNETDQNIGLEGDFQNISSAQSLSTATQTHEVRMPMYLPTFKPATGCTNASDFIVRCFVARLRSGITVVKHGRSRWCKSRLRILHIHPDGRSLSWKPAQGEPTSSKRPPKLDLTTCLEVRHAWSPDPQNPMYTGTPILRQKCEAANAHKSFALIFPKRTVDITSVTADQCKVLMEGFSALCFRLQVANLAGRGSKKGAQKMPEEEEVATTASNSASNTLTNNSTSLSPTAAAAAAKARTYIG
jgi:hypothetical protein